jgi:hypothetical protein
MKELILKWYDEMIKLNEELENYEKCAYFKSSRDAYLKFHNEGTVLYKGKRYTPEEVIELVNKSNKDD